MAELPRPAAAEQKPGSRSPRSGVSTTTTKVAAVIVSYNSGATLGDSVNALQAGTVRPPVYIVDNASSDDSASIIREHVTRGGVHGRFNDVNVGFAAANNQVLREIDAEYFLLVNPDCMVNTNTVETFLSCLDTDPGIGIAGGALSNPDGSLQKTSKRRLPTPWSSLARTLGLHRWGGARGAWSDFDLAGGPGDLAHVEEVEAISGAMMCVRETALSHVGLLDEGYFLHCEDLDWCKRFRDGGYKVVYVPGAKAVHLKGGSGRDFRVVWHLHRGMARFHRKHYANRYPYIFNLMVYTAIAIRGALLMAIRLFRKPGH